MAVDPCHPDTLPEGWFVGELGAIGKTYGGLTGKSKGDFGVGNARYVTFLNVVLNVGIDPSQHDRVNVGPIESQNLVLKGDLLFNGSSETPEEVGLCSEVTEAGERLFLNSFCFGFRPFPGVQILPRFMAYHLRGPVGRRVMVGLAQGSTRYNLSKRALLAARLPLPPLAEQEAIAEALTDVDALIESLEQLIAKKRLIKQGVMQELLTGKRRLPGFEGEWQEIALGDHVRFLRRGTHSRADQGNDGPVINIHYGDVHAATRPRLSERDLRALPTLADAQAAGLDHLTDGDVIFADASEDKEGIGKAVEIMGIRNMAAVAGTHTIAARFDKSILADGFKGLIQYIPEFASQIRRLASGTKVYGFTRSQLGSVTFRVPGVGEQRAIAELYRTMDDEIDALSQQRNKVRALKQGMMQQLLTGRIRLL